jgi:DNA-nicking Smr family endonuclease
MNNPNHKSLDLHGSTHEEAEMLIDEFIIKNIDQLPLEIITGNSVDMLEILRKIVSTHNLKLIPSNSFNMGSYLVTMPLYID